MSPTSRETCKSSPGSLDSEHSSYVMSPPPLLMYTQDDGSGCSITDTALSIGGENRRRGTKLDFKKLFSDKKLFRCHQCRYVTDRKNNLKRHVLTMHEKCTKTLECCDRVFANKAALREHVVSQHKEGYNCRICGRSFCRKALLKRHVSVHSGQKDYVCHICGYATSHKSNLDRHKKRHLPKEVSNGLHINTTSLEDCVDKLPRGLSRHGSYSASKLFSLFQESYSEYMDGKIGLVSMPLTATIMTDSELSKRCADKSFFKKRLLQNFEKGRDHDDVMGEDDPNRAVMSEGEWAGPEPSDVSMTDSGSDLSCGRKSPVSTMSQCSMSSTRDLEDTLGTEEIADLAKPRLCPTLHKCRNCARVFQTQLALSFHLETCRQQSVERRRMLRPLTVQFRRKNKHMRRLPSFLLGAAVRDSL